jgi:hypothetical protein
MARHRQHDDLQSGHMAMIHNKVVVMKSGKWPWNILRQLPGIHLKKISKIYKHDLEESETLMRFKPGQNSIQILRV